MVVVRLKEALVLKLKPAPVVAVELRGQRLRLQRRLRNLLALWVVGCREKRAWWVLRIIVFFDDGLLLVAELLEMIVGLLLLKGLHLDCGLLSFLLFHFLLYLLVVECLGHAVAQVALLPLLLEDAFVPDVRLGLLDVERLRHLPDDFVLRSEFKPVWRVGLVGVRLLPRVALGRQKRRAKPFLRLLDRKVEGDERALAAVGVLNA